MGAAIARELATRGWRCVLLARREEQLQAVAAEVGGEAEVCDVAERAAVDAVAARVAERHPRVKLLVNSAGVPARADFLSGDAERIERVVGINYLGSVWCLRAFLPVLEAARPADVVNVVSVAGTVALGASGPYAASKHAQLAFSRASTVSLRRRGIAMHTVNPGFVETPGFPQRNALRSRLFRRIVIEPDEVARHVVGLLGRGPTETTIPRFYRVASIAQALAPQLLGRVGGRYGNPYR